MNNKIKYAVFFYLASDVSETTDGHILINSASSLGPPKSVIGQT